MLKWLKGWSFYCYITILWMLSFILFGNWRFYEFRVCKQLCVWRDGSWNLKILFKEFFLNWFFDVWAEKSVNLNKKNLHMDISQFQLVKRFREMTWAPCISWASLVKTWFFGCIYLLLIWKVEGFVSLEYVICCVREVIDHRTWRFYPELNIMILWVFDFLHLW